MRRVRVDREQFRKCAFPNTERKERVKRQRQRILLALHLEHGASERRGVCRMCQPRMHGRRGNIRIEADAGAAAGLDEPIAVCGITRPPWLAAVVDEVGVITCTIEEALALYA